MRVVPLHEHFSPEHLTKVTEQMRTLGPPRLKGYFDQETATWFAREGTHRLRAAKVLGLTPVMLPVPWKRGRKALERARFCFEESGHLFLEESCVLELEGGTMTVHEGGTMTVHEGGTMTVHGRNS